MIVQAPFTPEQVIALIKWQTGYEFHPFTCANRDKNHPVTIDESDHGILVPTVRGWICQFCDYTQDWAHDFMLEL